MDRIRIEQKKYGISNIKHYFLSNKKLFSPPLEERVNIDIYTKKIYEKATQFWVFYQEEIIGFAAVYLNDKISKKAYITTISIKVEFQGKGIGKGLFFKIFKHAKEINFKVISLEVHKLNYSARIFYGKLGFMIEEDHKQTFILVKNIV